MLVCMCGDTPGTNYVAGFKEGVGFALRKCRMCLATANDILVKVCKLCKLTPSNPYYSTPINLSNLLYNST